MCTVSQLLNLLLLSNGKSLGKVFFFEDGMIMKMSFLDFPMVFNDDNTYKNLKCQNNKYPILFTYYYVFNDVTEVVSSYV